MFTEYLPALIKAPIAEAVIPLPNEDTTPPVTKIYFAIINPYKKFHVLRF